MFAIHSTERVRSAVEKSMAKPPVDPPLPLLTFKRSNRLHLRFEKRTVTASCVCACGERAQMAWVSTVWRYDVLRCFWNSSPQNDVGHRDAAPGSTKGLLVKAVERPSTDVSPYNGPVRDVVYGVFVYGTNYCCWTFAYRYIVFFGSSSSFLLSAGMWWWHWRRFNRSYVMLNSLSIPKNRSVNLSAETFAFNTIFLRQCVMCIYFDVQLLSFSSVVMAGLLTNSDHLAASTTPTWRTACIYNLVKVSSNSTWIRGWLPNPRLVIDFTLTNLSIKTAVNVNSSCVYSFQAVRPLAHRAVCELSTDPCTARLGWCFWRCRMR